MEDRAAVRRVLRRRLAAVRLRDLAHDREAEARAGQAARRRARGRSGRRRGAGRPRRCPGPWSRTITSPSAHAAPRRHRRAGSTSPRCRAGSQTARSSRARRAAHHRLRELGLERDAAARAAAPARPPPRRARRAARPRRSCGARRACELDEVADERRRAPRAAPITSASSRSRSSARAASCRARAPRRSCAGS